jgi:hypothetical protein
VHQECSFNWNDINDEVENGVDGYMAMEPIGNMHVNEDVPVGSKEHGYDQADRKLNDDNYNDVADDHGKENGNELGRNGDSNDSGEGGDSGTMIDGNIDATSIGNGDGGSNNTPQEEPTKEGFNQGIEIQDNLPPFDKNVNSQVPNAIIHTMKKMKTKMCLLSKCFPLLCRKRMPSIGTTFIGLDRPSPPTSNRPSCIVDLQRKVQF